MTNAADFGPEQVGEARVAAGSERDLCEEVEVYVRRQPWRALSIALAIGFVIGRFIL
jgi:ElaB/YqjD/DUF883 family membrane-anchored ribosome-binding protein